MPEREKITTSCPACGSVDVTFADADISFPYGASPNTVELQAHVPIGSCSACGLEFTDKRTERLKHEAICRHLGLRTPSQIEALRRSWSMSRERFSELTKIGEASVARWERGTGLQNPALDQLLYLLGFADNMRRLIERETESRSIENASLEVEEIAARFPNIKNAKQKKTESLHFHLRYGGT